MMKMRYPSYSQYIFIIFSFSLILVACNPVPIDVPLAITGLPATDGVHSSLLQVYFTDPSALNTDTYEGGPDTYLAAAINGARFSVDMAAYSLNLWSIRDALIHAYQRGVKVRMVMESDNMDVQEVQALKDTGIPIIGDQREGLMHNKFMVIDQSEVWTGSLNFTVSGTYKDNNNLIRIQSSEVAEAYTCEFNEMFDEDLFGMDTGSTTPYPPLTINGTPVEIYFSPDDGVAERIIDLVNGAQESIYFMAYTFTSQDIGTAIIERAHAGVSVAGVMDTDQILSNQGTEYDKFMQSGLDIRKDGNKGLMHHKVIIIDQKIVITGSYNFTKSAEISNDENIVIIFSPDVATQYLQEFQKVYEQGN